MAGTLFVVATPLGNLQDITLRALEVLKTVDLIAAEDTRRARKLLNRFGVKVPVLSYWGPREQSRADVLIKHLKEGRSVALVSDAGTPAICDPGRILVQRAVENDILVIPVPGPSALVAALSASGLPSDRFVFLGYIPSKAGERQALFQSLALETRTMVLYETPHRILASLADMANILGETREAVACRELTKVHEEILRGTLSFLVSSLEAREDILGEFVMVVAGREEGSTVSEDEALQEMKQLLRQGVSRKDAARKLASLYGLSSKTLYDRSLE